MGGQLARRKLPRAAAIPEPPDFDQVEVVNVFAQALGRRARPRAKAVPQQLVEHLGLVRDHGQAARSGRASSRIAPALAGIFRSARHASEWRPSASSARPSPSKAAAPLSKLAARS